MRKRRDLSPLPGGLSLGGRRGGGIRSSALVALLLAFAGVLVLFKLLLPPPAGPALPLISSKQCLECHPGAGAEWQLSHHAFAFENPEVRKLSQDFRNEECLACHAPRPVLDFAPGERVLSRNSERAQGVDCLACHALPGGGVATADPRPDSSAPCRPAFTPRMNSVEH
ncbi:MAG: multiheme c-type cytochrome, partial [Planctomycetota bacterium]